MHTPGLHHVTAIAGDPNQNVQWYTTVLGLRFVKRTVNFDDPTTYHLYYGDERGTPGTILTFFPFPGVPPGSPGIGHVTATAFVIPHDAVTEWIDRLSEYEIDFNGPTPRFNEKAISFSDPDGQPLELITGDSDIEPWDDSPVDPDIAPRGFHSVTLASRRPSATGDVLEILGYEPVDEAGGRTRYSANSNRATVVDIFDERNTRGRQGTGTVHHVAFRAKSDAVQQQIAERLVEYGISVTEQKDRQYFRSIYFREPGGILFEIATDGPGFLFDESLDELGTGLKLPPWLESERDRIERGLKPLEIIDTERTIR